MIRSVAHSQINLSPEQIISFILNLPSSSYPAILDSCQYQDYGLYFGRYLIATYSPETCLQITDNEAYLFSRQGEKIVSGNTLAFFDEVLDEWRVEPNQLSTLNLPCSNGAAIGGFAYDLGRQFEKLPTMKKSSHIVPDLFLFFYTVIIVYDYLTKQTTLIACSQKPNQAQARLQAAQAQLSRFSTSISNLDITIKHLPLSYKSSFTKTDYLQAVEEIKAYIKAGDIYQANLTQQFQIDLAGLDEREIFLRLRKFFPVPFLAYLKTPSWTVISASPERFLHRQGKEIASYPIKGTRARGLDAESDNQLAKELVNSEKDCAENIMIVDLLRNDLGRISEIGTIDASKILSLQALPTVFHLVSKITGILRSEITVSELLKATFPCGSITGAPKLRAIEILAEVEPVRRGLSMGAIGWIGYNGDLDLNVAIRTLFIQDGQAYFNVGGGVVADSNPMDEYEESLTKAQAMFQAIGLKL